jgi:hypothetical protein
MQKSRNCEGDESVKGTPIKVFDKVYYRCPMSITNPQALDLVGLIMQCEGSSGMFGGSGRESPSTFYSEPPFYLNARQIILSEQARIRKWKDAKEKSKKENG